MLCVWVFVGLFLIPKMFRFSLPDSFSGRMIHIFWEMSHLWIIGDEEKANADTQRLLPSAYPLGFPVQAAEGADANVGAGREGSAVWSGAGEDGKRTETSFSEVWGLGELGRGADSLSIWPRRERENTAASVLNSANQRTFCNGRSVPYLCHCPKHPWHMTICSYILIKVQGVLCIWFLVPASVTDHISNAP